MFDLPTIIRINAKASAPKAETETSRHCSCALSGAGVVLHSAKQRATVFLKGTDRNKFVAAWNRDASSERRDRLVEGYFA